MQRVMYPIFLTSCATGTLLSIAVLWGADSPLVSRVAATLVLIALASALIVGASREMPRE